MITKVVFDKDVVRFVNTGKRPFVLTMRRTRTAPIGVFEYSTTRWRYHTVSSQSTDKFASRALMWWMFGTQLSKVSTVQRDAFVLLDAVKACAYRSTPFPIVDTPLFPARMWDVTFKHWDKVMWGLVCEYVAKRLVKHSFTHLTDLSVTHEDILK